MTRFARSTAFQAVSLIMMFLFTLAVTGCNSARQRSRERNTRSCQTIRDNHLTWFDEEENCWRYWVPEDPENYDGAGEWACSPDRGNREVTMMTCTEESWCRRNLGLCIGMIFLGVLLVGAIVVAGSMAGNRPRQTIIGNMKGDSPAPNFGQPLAGVTVRILDASGEVVAEVETSENGGIILPPDMVDRLRPGAIYIIEGAGMSTLFQFNPEPLIRKATSALPALP